MQRLSDLFQRIVDFIEPLAEQLGGPGLALVSFLDSSFLSLPQVTDALTVGLTLKYPTRWFVHAAWATFGSTAGCLALYAVARQGGERFLRKRLKARHIERGLALFQKYGWLTVAVPSLLPPPAPFKLFVLLAGMASIRPLTFLVAVLIGRTVRYGGEAWLTYRYGERATEFIQGNLPMVSLAIAGIVLAAGLVVIFLRRQRASE